MRHNFWLMPKARSGRIMSNFSTLHASETGREGNRNKERDRERRRKRERGQETATYEVKERSLLAK